MSTNILFNLFVAQEKITLSIALQYWFSAVNSAAGFYFTFNAERGLGIYFICMAALSIGWAWNLEIQNRKIIEARAQMKQIFEDQDNAP